jgi:hypothetical protein
MGLQDLLLGLLAVYPAFAESEKCDVYMDGSLPIPDLSQVFPRAAAAAPPPVDLYVHVVAGSNKREDGYLTVSMPHMN